MLFVAGLILAMTLAASLAKHYSRVVTSPEKGEMRLPRRWQKDLSSLLVPDEKDCYFPRHTAKTNDDAIYETHEILPTPRGFI